jgi:hypothetical protein
MEDEVEELLNTPGIGALSGKRTEIVLQSYMATGPLMAQSRTLETPAAGGHVMRPR